MAQGAIGIQIRDEDEKMARYIGALNHEPTKTAVDCERAFLAALDGNCRTPIAGQAKIVDGKLVFEGLIAKVDGTTIMRASRTGELADAVKMGTEAGEELKEKVGGDALAFFGESEVLPEPKSSVTGVATDGLGGYAQSAPSTEAAPAAAGAAASEVQRAAVDYYFNRLSVMAEHGLRGSTGGVYQPL